MALLDRLLLLIDADGSRAYGELDRLGRKTKETLTLGQQFGRDFFQGLGIGAGVLSGAAAADALQRLARFTIEATKSAEQDTAAQIVLEKALQSSAGATREQVSATEDWISKTSTQLGVLDDELRPALAVLVRSTHDVGNAQRLLNLALDVSAGTGKDLSTVSNALAKTYEGNTTALARLVPELTGYVKEGDSAEQMLQKLNESFGGTAQSVADQAGSYNQLKVATSELTETYGREFLPTVRLATDSMKAFQGQVDNPFGAVFLKSISEVLQPLNGLATLTGRGGRSLNDVKNELLGIVPTGQAASGALQSVGYGASTVRKDADEAAHSVRGFEDALNDLADAVGRQFSSIFGLSTAQDRFNSALEDSSSSGSRAASSTRDQIAADFDKERSARNVLQAQMDLAEAEKNLEKVREGASEREKARARLDLASAQNRVAQANQRVADATNELNRASGRRGNPQEAARARQNLADALNEQERATLDLQDTQDRTNETAQRGTEGAKDLADATKQVEDAQWALKEALEAQRRSAQQDEQDGGPVGRTAVQQRDKFREAAKAAGEVIEELIRAGAPQDVINEKIQEMVKRLQAAGTEAGVTQAEIKKTADLLVALGLINQAENERQQASAYGFGFTTLREGLDSLRRRGIYVPDIAYTLAGGRASGGSTNAGAAYLVGERGPEVLQMGNSPGWVTPMSGSGFTININGPVYGDRAQLERMMFEALESARRRGWN